MRNRVHKRPRPRPPSRLGAHLCRQSSPPGCPGARAPRCPGLALVCRARRPPRACRMAGSAVTSQSAQVPAHSGEHRLLSGGLPLHVISGLTPHVQAHLLEDLVHLVRQHTVALDQDRLPSRALPRASASGSSRRSTDHRTPALRCLPRGRPVWPALPTQEVPTLLAACLLGVKKGLGWPGTCSMCSRVCSSRCHMTGWAPIAAPGAAMANRQAGLVCFLKPVRRNFRRSLK